DVTIAILLWGRGAASFCFVRLSRALAQDDMRRSARTGDVLHTLVTQSTRIEAVQQVLAAAEQDRGDYQMELVDESGPQILPDGGDAAAQADILAAGRVPRLLERGVNPLGDEPELRAARHPERRSGMVREYENRGVIRR